MIILGIDPGTTSAGYAFVRKGNPDRLLNWGIIPIKSPSAPERLGELHKKLFALIKNWKPEAVAVEKIFFSKNVKTALAVSEARGVILLTTSLARVPLYEYTPLEVKKAVTGDGGADKTQVKKMVQLLLKETGDLKAKDDVFDAIALALTCYTQINLLKKIKGRPS